METKVIKFPKEKRLSEVQYFEMLNAALSEMLNAIETKPEYLYSSFIEEDTIHWIAVNEHDDNQSLRVSVAPINLSDYYGDDE